MPISSTDPRAAVQAARDRGAGARLATAALVAALAVAGIMGAPRTTDAYYAATDRTEMSLETRSTCRTASTEAVDAALATLAPTGRWSFDDSGGLDVVGTPEWGQDASFPCDTGGALVLGGGAASAALTAAGTTSALALVGHDAGAGSGDILTLASPDVVVALRLSGSQAVLRTWTPGRAAVPEVPETPETPAVPEVPAVPSSAAVTLATGDLDPAQATHLVGLVVRADGSTALVVDGDEIAGAPVTPLPGGADAVRLVLGSVALLDGDEVLWDSEPATAASFGGSVDEVVLFDRESTAEERLALLATTALW